VDGPENNVGAAAFARTVANEEQRTLERVKELSWAHRNRKRPAGWMHLLSAPMARRYLRGFFNAPDAVPVSPVEAPQESGLALSACGHATVQVVSPRARLLIDPFLTMWMRGLRRASLPALAPADRKSATALLLTSDRSDRCAAATLKQFSPQTTVVAPAHLAGRLGRLGFDKIHAVVPGDEIVHKDVQIVAVPARNGDGRPSVGYVVQEPDVAVYCSGATGYFSGFAALGRTYRPDVAVLPISGYEPETLRSANLSPLDAAYAFEDLGARLLVPVAHGVFPVGYEAPGEPLDWLRSIAEARGFSSALSAVSPGERLRVTRTSVD